MDKKLQNKLKSYTALTAVAALSANVANAGIVPTSVEYTGGYESYDIDIDGNGTIDFVLNHSDFASVYSSYYPGIILGGMAIEIGSGGEGVASAYYGINAANLREGNLISTNMIATYNPYPSYVFQSQSSFSLGALFYISSSFQGQISGDFNKGKNQYIGVQFDINGSSHLGWIRININSAESWTIKDWAYEDQANTDIIAGGNGLAVNENSNMDLSINSADGNINITTDALNSKVDVVNMQGQIVASTVITSNTTTISNDFAKGVYVVNIYDNKGKAVTRKIMI